MNINDWPSPDKERLFEYLRWNSYRSEHHKLFYVATPKVACTSLKWWFAELEGYAQAIRQATDSGESDPDLVIHDTFSKVASSVTGLMPDALSESISSQAYFRFAVVRNPYKRIFSAWQSKLLLREPLQVGPYLKYDFFNRALETPGDIAIAFEGFLEHLSTSEAPNFWDLHWTPQVTLLRPDLIAYTKLVQLEHAKELSVALAEWMGPDFVDPFAIRSANESLIPYLPELITARSAELIRTLYAEDFAKFGYSEQLPSVKESFSAEQFDLALKAISHIRGRNQRIGEMRTLANRQAEEIRLVKSSLTAIRNELAGTKNELNTIQSSKWFRLRDALINQPWGFRKVAQITYLIGAMATPALVRKKLAPCFSWFIGRVNAPQSRSFVGNANEAYWVRIPKPAITNRPRIVHVVANFMTGGSSRLVVDLIEYQGAHYEQSVVTSFIPSPPAYIGIDITEIRPRKSIQPFIEHFLKVKPDLLHIHYWGDSDEPWYAKVINAAEQLAIPIVENINTPTAPYFSSSVQRYVYVSNYVRHVFGKDHPSHITVYPGSDFARFNRAPGEPLPENCIGMVYRLERDKLNKDAILPFIMAVQKRPQTKVLIVGGGSLLEHFRQAVAGVGLAENFEFTGYVSYESLPDLYRKMSIFVAPVWNESFGQVSPFAMSMGVPVVGYNVGALFEIIGDQSLLAPPGDSDALANIIVDLLNNRQRREQIGQRNREIAHQKFSVESMVESYAGLYRELVGKQ